jgi:hypothetical protein
LIYCLHLNQVPHAFQDILGAEATPTLCYTIFAFSSFIQRWEELKEVRPEWDHFITPGLEKLEDYSMYLDYVPAYTLAMGKVFLLYEDFNLTSHFVTALDPRFKLNPYHDDMCKYQRARRMLVTAV